MSEKGPAKVSLYLEFRHFLKGALFKNIGTGLLTSYDNQMDVLRSLGIPFVEHWDRESDILQINTPWLKSVYLMKRAHAQKKKVIIWAHVTMEDALQVFWFMPLIAPLVKRYLTYSYSLADVVFCPSEYTKSLLLGYGLPAEKLCVLSNGVNTGRFQANVQKREAFRNEYGLSGVTIGTVGLVIPRKGIDTFLELARQFPEHQFLWIGKIYSKALVKPLPKDLPANVRFTGYVDDIVAAINALDIFIFPSYEENQGMAILEAAAIGLPIILRDLPVYRGWMIPGENCLVAREVSEFSKAITHLTESPTERAALRAGALKLGQQESIGVVGEKVSKVYARLLGR